MGLTRRAKAAIKAKVNERRVVPISRMAAELGFQDIYRRGAVDRLGEAKERLAAVKVDLATVESVSDEIRHVWMKGCPDATPGIFHGDRYTVHVAQRKFERAIDKVRLWKKLGATAFLKACTVTIKAFETVVPAVEREGFVSMEQTGSREITVVPLPAEAPAKKKAA